MVYRFKVGKEMARSGLTPEGCLNLVLMEASNFEYPVSYRLSHIFNLLEGYYEEKTERQKEGVKKGKGGEEDS